MNTGAISVFKQLIYHPYCINKLGVLAFHFRKGQPVLGSSYEVILYTVHQSALQHHHMAVRYLALLDSRPQSKT